MRECRYRTTLTRHVSLFNPLCHQTRVGHSNNSGGCSKNTNSCTLAPATATVTPTTTQLEKWVKNMSGVPLTKAHISLLANGPNFTVAPRHPQYGEYIAVVEQACQNPEPHNTEEFRAEIRGHLNTHPGRISPRKKPRHLQN